MSDIKFNEFKKVKLNTFNKEVTNPSNWKSENIINGESNIDDKLWGVREEVNSRPVSQLWLGGKKYGEVNPKEEHKLPYFYPKDNTNHQYKYTPDFLLVEDIYVVENEEEFIECKGIEVSSPDIKNEWIQYNENASMPEYGVGYSTTENKHIGINTTTGNTGDELYGSGYGLWESDENHIITNPKNSCDFNAFINPQKSNKFNYTSIIGTNKGRTTGDWGGFALIDDSNAVARHIIDTEGNKYYRNTLYDLTDDSGVCNSTLTDSEGNTLWCAWVNDLNNGSAYVIYTNQIKKDAPYTTYVEELGKTPFDNGGKYKDNVPEIGDSVTVFYIKNNTTKTDRLNFEDINKTIVVDKIQEAYGYVVTLNVLTQNSNDIHALHYSGTSYGDIPPGSATKATKGTIQVFAEVWPCDGDFFGSRTEYQGGATEIPKQCHFVLGTQTNGTSFTGYDYMLGSNLVEYNSLFDVSNTNGYTFIRSDMSFDNGVLNVKFSDVNGKKTNTLLTDTELNDLLSNENLNTNFPLNGSELIIDFNSNEYSIKYRDSLLNTVKTKTFDSLIYKEIPIKVKNASGVEEEITVNVIDSFKGDVKFGLQQWSFANILIKSNGFSYKERLILDIQNDKVWEYDSVDGEYKENVGKKPVEYFTGSHISYNHETNKLFYSNGTEITCIARNCGCFDESDFIATPMINVTYNELYELTTGSTLIPGMQYCLTDYECTVNIKEYDWESLVNKDYAKARNEGHFDIILVADNESTLNENVRFTHHEGDNYFTGCNLSAWEGKYTIYNDTNKFNWAYDTNGKGVIYWLKDEWNNECPYDFKNIQFKRVENEVENWYYTFNLYNYGNKPIDGSIYYNNSGGEDEYAPKTGVKHNVIKPLIISEVSPGYSINIERYKLPIIIFHSNDDIDYFEGFMNNSFGYCCNLIFSLNGTNDNTFGDYCKGNTFGNNFQYNTFRNNCCNNTFGNNCCNNTFGNYCYGNILGDDFQSNTFGNNCYENTFGKECYYNTFVNNCWGNTFGKGCNSNILGNDCYGNILGDDFQSNTFGNNCYENTFGKECYYNTFVNNCWGNTFGESFQSNTFGKNCYYNTFGNDYIKQCRFGDGVSYCSISGITTSNLNYLQNITFLSNIKGDSNSKQNLNENNYLSNNIDSENISYELFCGFDKNNVYKCKTMFDSML